jgi:transposase
MGRKSKTIDLTEAEKTALEKGYKYSKSSHFSRRCHFVLLKNQGKTSQEIADIFGVTIQPVNRWCNRYLESGIAGLQTKVGQGRKPILDKATDQSIIKKTVQQERQRLKNAKEILENELDKSFSLKTLQRFLKTLAVDGSE